MWFDRRGAPLGAAGSGASFSQPSLSRDGQSIAARRIDPETQNSDIWLIDATSGRSTKLTQGEFSAQPLWSPDGSSIVFTSQRRRAPPNLYFKSLSASVEEQRLFESRLVNHTTDWSRDGRFVVYSTQNEDNGWDVMVLPMSGPESERQPRPYLSTEFDEHFGRVSPDGRWLAYMSDESGVNEIYVQSFPAPGAKQRISVAGGVEPVWRGDGTELYYVAPDDTLMAVPMANGPALRPGAPMPLFKTRFSRRIIRRFQFDPTYVVSNDGRRFLITTVAEEIGSVPTKILFNWPSELGSP
jgi:Tol biopolymer transport system component